MTIGRVGKKCGMTRIFKEDGTSIPVTVVKVQNTLTQIKTKASDGYDALQLTMGEVKLSRVTKPLAGHFAKANVAPGEGLWEFRATEEELAGLEVGAPLTLELFQEGQLVDVTGISIGKGFQGGVKRHNFRTQDATHGNSLSHRVLGSIGQNQTPGRVFKGKKMAGHMGHRRVTIQSLTVAGVDAEEQLLFIKGAIPGPVGGIVLIQPAVKA